LVKVEGVGIEHELIIIRTVTTAAWQLISRHAAPAGRRPAEVVYSRPERKTPFNVTCENSLVALGLRIV
jgi:hypothetical protein